MIIHGKLLFFVPKDNWYTTKQVDTYFIGLSRQEAARSPYIASMGVYVFKTDFLLKFLKWRYSTSNDFGSEIIPAAVREHDVQELNQTAILIAAYINNSNYTSYHTIMLQAEELKRKKNREKKRTLPDCRSIGVVGEQEEKEG